MNAACAELTLTTWQLLRHTVNTLKATCWKHHVSQKLPQTTSCFQQVALNMFPKSCHRQQVALTNCIWHVESNLLPKSCRGQHVAFNMLKATCCQKVARKLPQATSCFQQVAFNLLTKCCSKVTRNKLVSTCCFQHAAKNVALGNIWEKFSSNKSLRNLIDRSAQAIMFNVSKKSRDVKKGV